MIYHSWEKTPWYLRLFGYSKKRCWAVMVYQEGSGFWTYED
jgi:hypothetical protein